ncbi:MAG TPA: type IX secretion system membrane protein PorP/SprF [Fulvivirga sp.]|nr:type IX secretion system membrane protein PorP/SprF [Fulvivirga sp.]
MRAILIVVLIGFGINVQAQLDPLYNQYLFNQSMINPAYTGINDVFNATAISRAQWAGIEGAPITNTLNLSSSFLSNKVGAGLLLVSDQYGINTNTEIQLMYSYRIEMNNGRSLSFGLQTGYINYKYDFDKLNQEQTDPELVISDDNFSKSNFGAGVYYKTDHYYLGVSVPRILDTDVKDGDVKSTRYKRHFYVSAGYLFDQLLAIKFKPSVLLKVVDGQPASIDINASFLLKEALWVGTTLRNFNAIGLNTQFEINNQLRLGYSFELPLNGLSNNAYGTHELMLSLDLEIFNGHAIGRRYF